MSLNARLQEIDFLAPPMVQDWRKKSLVGGGVFGIVSIIGAILNPAQAMHAYLLAFMFCLGLTLGSMALLMLWHLSGGEWGQVFRRIFEAAARTLPMMMVAFIPILIGLKTNYEWAGDLAQAGDHMRQLSSQYLRPSYFVLRAVVYFVAWWVLVHYLTRWSDLQDSPPDRNLGDRFRRLSGGGLVLYGWTITFAAIDWVMSLAAPWPSSIFALIFMVGQALIAMSFAIVIATLLVDVAPMSVVLRSRHFHDNGKLLTAFVMLWGWFSFSQWLIIWSGNLPEEIRWFADRIHGGWGVVGAALIFGHFCIPFALLLSRGLKQNPHRLVWVAAWMILMRYLDLYWYIEPNFSREHFYFHWTYAAIPLALFGLWLAYFFWNLARRPLVALHDPHLRAILGSEHE